MCAAHSLRLPAADAVCPAAWLARLQAHQRRGESDLVAHWVYVLLALDPQAAEWEFMLQPAA